MIIAALSLLVAQAASPQPLEWLTCTDPQHYDGDDIRCSDDHWRILARGHGMRIAALDAPELGTPRGRASREALARITAGRSVICAWNGTWAPGWHGLRPVVDCKAGGMDIACWMVKQRAAAWWPAFDPGGTRQRACNRVS